VSRDVAPGGIVVELRGVPAWVATAWKQAEARPRSGPRRAATTSRVRPRGRRATVRAAASRDGPSDEPPLAILPPAVLRRWLLHALGGEE
jgi:hypothetical protein